MNIDKQIRQWAQLVNEAEDYQTNRNIINLPQTHVDKSTITDIINNITEDTIIETYSFDNIKKVEKEVIKMHKYYLYGKRDDHSFFIGGVCDSEKRCVEIAEMIWDESREESRGVNKWGRSVGFMMAFDNKGNILIYDIDHYLHAPEDDDSYTDGDVVDYDDSLESPSEYDASHGVSQDEPLG